MRVQDVRFGLLGLGVRVWGVGSGVWGLWVGLGN